MGSNTAPAASCSLCKAYRAVSQPAPPPVSQTRNAHSLEPDRRTQHPATALRLPSRSLSAGALPPTLTCSPPIGTAKPLGGCKKERGASLHLLTVVSVTPNSGSGVSQVFTAVYSDPHGASILNAAYVLFNTSVSGVNACYVEYYPTTNLLYLKNDAGTALSTGIAPGSSATVSNSQCTLSGTGSSYTTSGNSATLNVALTFTGSTSTNIYLYAGDKNNQNTGWIKEGSWTP